MTRQGQVWSVATTVLLAGVLAGCEHKQTEDERIRQQAAEDTRQIKQDAKSFVADTRKEALHAQRQAKDVIAGVKEGLAEPGSPGSKSSTSSSIDINSASAAQLETLPGVTPMVARRIINGRPYDSADALVSKGHVPQKEYDRIADRIVAR